MLAFLGFGGEEEDRTPDLVIANDALSQLSYPPTSRNFAMSRAFDLARYDLGGPGLITWFVQA